MPRTLLIGAILLLLTGHARAASDADWKACQQAGADANARIATCSRVLEDANLKPTDRARAHFALGNGHYARSDFTAALADFERAIALNPAEPQYFLWRGRVHLSQGRHDSAIADADAALRLRPDFAEALMNRGLSRAGKGQFDQAIADYNLAIKASPRLMLAYYNRARALESRGRTIDAIADHERVIAMAPRTNVEDDQRALALAGESLKRLKGDPGGRLEADRKTCSELSVDKAVAACSRIIASGAASVQERISALNNRGRRHDDSGRPDDAIADFDAAIRLNPRLPFLYNNRGNANRSKGHYEQALADYDEALKVDPNYLLALRNKGFAYERAGDLERARETVEQLLLRLPRPGNREDERARQLAQTDQGRIAYTLEMRARDDVRRLKQVALVIANTNYAGSFESLVTPANDGRLVAAALRRAGFRADDVIERHDLDRKAMIAALREFEVKAQGADWAIVFFAGHGIRARSNLDYMIPVDARIESERDLPDEAVPLERVVERIADARKLQFVIFDACRSNELTRRLYASVELQRSGASNAPFAAPGLILAFSARRGQSALDGETNSPFAQALLAGLERPGANLETILAGAAEQVKASTADRQTPEIYGLSYGKEIVLVPSASGGRARP